MKNKKIKLFKLFILLTTASIFGVVTLVGCKKISDNKKIVSNLPTVPDYSYKLWYNKPAEKDFNAGFPIGNGKIGGMIYGSPSSDIIHINEGTIWTGSPYENNVEGAYTSLDALRKTQFSKDINQDKLWESKFIFGKQNNGDQNAGQTFQYAGQVKMDFTGHNNYDKSSYLRALNLNDGVATSEYSVDSVKYTKEYFANYPSNVLATKISSSENGKLEFTVSFTSDMNGKSSLQGDDTIIYDGTTADNKGIPGKLEFCVVVKIIPDGGKIVSSNNKLSIEGANSCVVFVTVATNFTDYKTLTSDKAKISAETMAAAVSKGYNELKKEHSLDYKAIFDKVAIKLGEDTGDSKPTDERLISFKNDQDASLVSLYFQYNRYLMISASREGGQPTNLQGIWNNSKTPNWDSKYTVNINTEMNYWPAFIANLNECAIPLTQKVNSLVEPASIAAKELYGIQTGWVLHHNTDLWNIAGPVDGPWGMTPVCGAWLTDQLFDNYLYTKDKAYLESIYEAMKGSTEFMLSFLTEYTDKDGNVYLVTCPSTSPEITQKGPKSKYVSYGSAFDNQILHQLFSDMSQAATILGKDDDLVIRVNAAKAKLPPAVKIGRWGQIQEFFFHDFDDPNDAHRHISNLVGVYPLTSVDIKNNADIKAAVEKTLVARTKPGDWTGWGIGWRIGQYARLSDGENAYKMLSMILNPANRLIYPNMFGAHPIGTTDKTFQIDGNFGALAGLSEMFVCSAYNDVNLLSAIPSNWKTGGVYGINAKGGFTISSLEWKDGLLDKVTVYSSIGGILNLRYADKLITIETEADKVYTFDGNLQVI